MTTDEQIRLLANQLRLSAPVVVARVTTDMPHVNAKAFALPREISREFGTNLGAIDVSIDGLRGLETPQAFEQPERAAFARSQITRMPDLIAICQMSQQCIVEKSMRIGNQAYSQRPTSSVPRQ